MEICNMVSHQRRYSAPRAMFFFFLVCGHHRRFSGGGGERECDASLLRFLACLESAGRRACSVVGNKKFGGRTKRDSKKSKLFVKLTPLTISAVRCLPPLVGREEEKEREVMGAGPWNGLAASDLLCKISTLDFDLAVEMAVMSTGLLAANQVCSSCSAF